ncbi:MAG: DUF4919 domain-containing protein [Ferruginibacter sp.]
MRIFITLILLFSGLKAYEQKLKDSVPPVPFDYSRDFKVILEKTKDRTSELYYHKLLVKLLNIDSSISRPEVLALMIGFTEDAHYKPWEDMQTEKEIFDLNDSADYQGSLDASKIYLATHPLSLRVNKERSYSYHQLKMKDSADYFMDLVDKIMGAMIYSGKGRTPETPIFSLGLDDGEHFIPNVGMTVAAKNTEWNKRNQFVEVIDAMDEMGIHKNYYFVIQHAKDKVDDDTINDSQEKKPKKTKKKESKKESKKDSKKDSKKSKAGAATDTIPPAVDSIPPVVSDSIPPAVKDSVPH